MNLKEELNQLVKKRTVENGKKKDFICKLGKETANKYWELANKKIDKQITEKFEDLLNKARKEAGEGNRILFYHLSQVQRRVAGAKTIHQIENSRKILENLCDKETKILIERDGHRNTFYFFECFRESMSFELNLLAERLISLAREKSLVAKKYHREYESSYTYSDDCFICFEFGVKVKW